MMRLNTLAVAATYGLLVLTPLAVAGDPVPKAPVLCLAGKACVPPATTAPPVTTTPGEAVTTHAIKFQPGWYAMPNDTCYPYDGSRGCTAAYLVNIVNTQICPNSNLVGMKLLTAPRFLIGDTPGVYSGADFGFTIIDQVLAALNACGKKLILFDIGSIGGMGDSILPFYPKFMVQPSCPYPANPNYDVCKGGTDVAGVYGVDYGQQGGLFGGMLPRLWLPGWRDVSIAATAAYCARYDSNPAFYAFNANYWVNPYFYDQNGHPLFPEAAFQDMVRQYVTGARNACPTTNVILSSDYDQPNPTTASTILKHIQANHASLGNTDVLDEETWTQGVFAGTNGAPSVIDYRGVVRNMEEIEDPDMCGHKGNHTPKQLFDILQNGNAGNRPRWPTHIIITMATSCDSIAPGTGWSSWLTFLSSISGKVMNGRDSTLRTPAEVKTNWCESAMTCQ